MSLEFSYLRGSWLDYNRYVPRSVLNHIPYTGSSILARELCASDVVLDIGCGPRSPLVAYSLRYSIGVELHDPYIQEAKSLGTHNEFIKADCTQLEFAPGSFDAVLALDVVEHLSKEDGLALLRNMKGWARKKVIIEVPNGFTSGHVVDGNELQLHRAGYTAKELRDLGFEVRGMRLKACPFSPNPFLNSVLQMIGYPMRALAYHQPMICWQYIAMPPAMRWATECRERSLE